MEKYGKGRKRMEKYGNGRRRMSKITKNINMKDLKLVKFVAQRVWMSVVLIKT